MISNACSYKNKHVIFNTEHEWPLYQRSTCIKDVIWKIEERCTVDVHIISYTGDADNGTKGPKMNVFPGIIKRNLRKAFLNIRAVPTLDKKEGT